MAVCHTFDLNEPSLAATPGRNRENAVLKLSTEDRTIVRHPALKHVSIEISTRDKKQAFYINSNTFLNVEDLRKFADLINGVLEMEMKRLSHLEESEVPA